MAKTIFKIEYRYIMGAFACLFGISTIHADLLSEGRDAFLNYDFELAAEKYEKYAKSLKKTPNVKGEELLDKYKQQLDIALSSLDNVQKIEIVDRIDVPSEDFFKYIKLSVSAGMLLSPDVSILRKRNNESDYAYSSESGDIMLWSENDDNQKEVIMQSERLMDGSWEKPIKLGSILNDGGDARNPFLLADGLTLYFSGNGEGSMGGYDLFVATKDATSGEFRQPMGLGYPFNSPYNEYMMAIDEENGIGWWVTDRNCLEEKVSIYVFKTNEVRKNYIPDEEDNIISLARIDDITLTQNPDTDYKRIMKEIDMRNNQAKKNVGSDFLFPLPGGKIAKNLSDFKSSNAKRNMQQYLQAVQEHDALEKKLSDLRKQYHKTDKKKGSSIALKNQILELEKQREWQRDRLKKMRNTIISAEVKE